MRAKLVSILIPAYNADPYLSQCIDSALNQTWPHCEIIVVDDGSTDNTLAIAKSYQSKGVRVYVQNHLGSCYTRNAALSHARGELIQFLDADDLLSPDKIEAQVIALQDNIDEVAICHTTYFYHGTDHTTIPLQTQKHVSEASVPMELLIELWGGNSQGAGDMIQTNAYLTPIEVIQKSGNWETQVNFSPDDDGEFFARVLLASRRGR